MKWKFYIFCNWGLKLLTKYVHNTITFILIKLHFYININKLQNEKCINFIMTYDFHTVENDVNKRNNK